jgi:hypothetical protein
MTDFWFTYIFSRRIHRKHIHFPAMDICEPHRKHRSLYCYMYSALHSTGNYSSVACVFVVAYCCRLYLAKGSIPRICLRGIVFTESLASNGSTGHNIKNCLIWGELPTKRCKWAHVSFTVSLSSCNNTRIIGRIIVTFDIGEFLLTKIDWNRARMTDNLRENHHVFLRAFAV